MAIDAVAEAGEALAQAWRSHRRIAHFTNRLFPTHRAQAQAIQDAMASAIGERVVGWKVAGVPGPMVGRVFESALYQLPARLPAWLAAHAPMVECEWGFELLGDLPPRPGGYGDDEVSASVNLRMMIEIVGTRFENGKHLPDNETDRLAIIADNAAGTALCVGPVVHDWRAMRLLDVPITLTIDGGEAAPNNPTSLRTEPLDILVWLANELSGRNIGLQSGQFVTTGSANVLQAIRPGNEAVAVFGDFATLKLCMDRTSTP